MGNEGAPVGAGGRAEVCSGPFRGSAAAGGVEARAGVPEEHGQTQGALEVPVRRRREQCAAAPFPLRGVRVGLKGRSDQRRGPGRLHVSRDSAQLGSALEIGILDVGLSTPPAHFGEMGK
jgi:hypothetical protein